MLSLVRAWILLSTLLVAGGWSLSALRQLNPAGYLGLFLLAALLAGWQRRAIGTAAGEFLHRAWPKIWRRGRRALPRVFFALALMSLAAGLLYVPTNADSNGYRIPRVLHWLAAGQWHWIHTYDLRMNMASCGYEWLTAPLLLFTHSDRLFFLANWVSYLLLPGLIFSVFVRIGVRPRVAWWWMWLLPSGWCFVFQASSTVNDSFAVIYALAAVDFALRARRNERPGDLWLSLLAAALLTGTKQTAIPLALLWLIAVAPAGRMIGRRLAATALVGLLALLVSGVPTMVLNKMYTGTISGMPAVVGPHSYFWKIAPLPSPVWGVLGNAFCLPLENLAPPFFPWAPKWNALMDRFGETSLGAHFIYFEHFGALRPGSSDATAGIGAGLCLLALISWLAGRRLAAGSGAVRVRDTAWWLRLVPWLLLLLFMAKIGTAQNARQFAPYYLFLFPALLVLPGQSALTRQRWWQRLGLLILLLAAGLVVVARNRPLLPAQTLVTGLQARHPHWGFLAKAEFLYSNRVAIENMRALVPPALPPGEAVIGYAATVGRSEPWVWLPFGTHRVEDVIPGETREQLLAKGIRYVAVEDSFLTRLNLDIDQLAAEMNGEVLERWSFEKDLNAPPAGLFLMRLRSNDSVQPKNGI